tara:strand:+ start:4277 stop:4549 length:273 start_codon:yes stop_codon:yes gene_type:complete
MALNNKKILFVGERSKLSTISRQLKVSRSTVECVNYNSESFDLDALILEQQGKSFTRVILDKLVRDQNPNLAAQVARKTHQALGISVAYA